MSMNTSVIRDINVNREELTPRVRSNGERSSSYIGKKDITSDWNKFAFLQNKTARLDKLRWYARLFRQEERGAIKLVA